MLSQVGALESSDCQCSHHKRFDPLTLKVGHVSPDIGVQGVDNHLPVGWSSDLNPAVYKTRGGFGAPPYGIVTDVLGLGEEVEQVAFVELCLADDTPLQECLASAIECAVEQRKEDCGVLGQDLAGLRVQGAEDLDVREDLFTIDCHCD